MARDIDQNPCHAHWVECPDREHQCFYMDRNNPVWREYLKAVIRIQIDAGVDGIQLDEAELPLGAFQYGACFCKDCMAGLPGATSPGCRRQPPAELAGVDLDDLPLRRLAAGARLRLPGPTGAATPLFGDYYALPVRGDHHATSPSWPPTRGSTAASQGREVLVSGNFFNLDPHVPARWPTMST